MPKPDTTGQNGSSVETRRPYERLVDEISGLAKIHQDNGGDFDIAADVIDRMCEAESLDDLLAAGKDGPEKAENILHKPIIIQPDSIVFRKSNEKFKSGSLGTYVQFKCTDAVSKEEKTVSTGAPNVVSAVRVMHKKGFLDDSPVLCIRSRETGNGELYYIDRA